MNKTILSRIEKQLLNKDEYTFGFQRAVYPDVPHETYKVACKIEIRRMRQNYVEFEILSYTSWFTETVKYIEDTDFKGCIRKLNDFIGYYKRLKDLANFIYKYAGHVSENSGLYDAYCLLKDDLPDGQDFEDFLDEYRSFMNL